MDLMTFGKAAKRKRGPLRIFLDPGTKHTGGAVWEPETWKAPGPRPPDKTFLWTQRKHDWQERAEEQAHNLNELLEQVRCRATVHCELPAFFGTGGGEVVASSGALVKLSMLAGAFLATAALNDAKFEPIPVRDWKGQLPKNIVEQRIKEFLGETACRSYVKDVWDAVGIGLFVRGDLFQ